MIFAELLNKEECKDFYTKWGTFSSVCYDSDVQYADRIGKSCHKSGHMSGSRAFYFIFRVKAPRSTIDQLSRSEVGVVKNIKSQRYTDSSQLEWHVPDEIKNDEGLRKIWDCHMDVAQLAYKSIISKLEEVYGYTGEKAREIARGVIPMDMMSEGVFGFTIEALENLMEKRLCNRAQAPIQELARQMKKEVVDVLPALKEFLAPPCMKYSVCPEGKHQCSQFKDVFLTTDEFNQLRTQPEYITLVKTIKEGE